jgi:hypothetical protein
MTSDVETVAATACCKPVAPVSNVNIKSDTEAVDFEPLILAFCCNY